MRRGAVFLSFFSVSSREMKREEARSGLKTKWKKKARESSLLFRHFPFSTNSLHLFLFARHPFSRRALLAPFLRHVCLSRDRDESLLYGRSRDRERKERTLSRCALPAFFGISRLGECSMRAALLVAPTCFFPCLVNRRSMKTLARDSSAPSRKRVAQNYAVEAHHGRGRGDSSSGNAQTRPRIGVNGGGDLRGRAPFAPTLSHFRSVRGLLRAPCICPSLSRSRLSSRRLRLVRRVAIDLGQETRV